MRTETITTTTQRKRRPRPGRGALVAVVALLALLPATGVGLRPAAAFQETTPEAEDPPAAAAPAVNAAAPHAQVIAHGLVIMPADQQVWRVRELVLPAADDARSETGGFSFTLQRAGASVVRNDVTEKRARLEPGEAFFLSADDPYTRHAESEDSTVWIVELVAPGTATEEDEGDIVFTSETMSVLPQGVHDVELVRDVLLPGEEAVLGGHVGPGLVLATDGALEVASGDATDTLIAVDGLLTGDTPTLRNAGADPVVYVAVLIGEPVRTTAPPASAASRDEGQDEDEENESSPAQATEEPEDDPAEEPVEEPVEEPSDPPAEEPDTSSGSDADGDGLSDDEEAALTTERTNPDTDGDGLEDGREVNEFGTDPFYEDTDGDGFSDGTEVNDAGTDPTDPNSVP